MIPSLRETLDFQRLASVLAAKGWAEASAGNMSLRLERAADGPAAPGDAAGPVCDSAVDMTGLVGERFLVTASGSRMRDLADDPGRGLCLLQVLDRRRLRLLAGRGTPSSEWPTHAGLHSLFKEERRGERAVLHCHPLNLIALSHLFAAEAEMNDRLFRMHHETRLFLPEELGLIPYALTGSLELAAATREKFKKHQVALWDKHGVIAAGATLDQALDRIEMADKAAAIYLLLRSAGIEPPGLDDDLVAATRRGAKA